MSLTRLEIAKRITVLPGITDKEAMALVNEVLGVMQEHLEQGGDLKLRGIGTLSWVVRRPRAGRNWQSGAPVTVPARRALRYVPGKNLEPRLVAPEAHEG